MATRLGRPTVWCLLAEQGPHVAGYVSLLPAIDSRRPAADPRLAHFWMLFVRAPWWGSGLATRLHGAACDAAAARGFTAMRLFTPAEEELGLSIVEYRRPV
jgi:GNAT superfamily N-acetyltransferase